MNFYIDFEATQFVQRIISIGCITEIGDSFYTLVKPVDGDKVNSFITNLTGIDNAALEEKGLAPEEALYKLRYFIQTHVDPEEPSFFYTYGKSDKDFLNRTICHCDFDFNEQTWFYSLAASFIDYSVFVNKFFKTETISLKKAAAWFKGEPIYQHHNALEDADLLRYVACGIAATDPPDQNPWAEEMLERDRKQKENNERINIISTNANGKSVQALPVDGIGTILEFATLGQAASYVHDNLLTYKQRKGTDKSVMKKHIKNAIRANKPYFKYIWKFKEEEVSINE